MGALLILFLGAVYVLVAYRVTVSVKPWWGKAIATAAFVLIPTADAIYGRIKFNQICEEEAGLKIYRTVEGVEGFYDPTSRPHDGWIQRYGYKFIEGNDLSGKDARINMSPDGNAHLETGTTLISKYAYDVKKGDLSDIYYRIEQSIRVRSTNEVLGKQVNINYAGGWFERFVGSLYASRGTAGICGPGVSMDSLVTETLKPVR